VVAVTVAVAAFGVGIAGPAQALDAAVHQCRRHQENDESGQNSGHDGLRKGSGLAAKVAWAAGGVNRPDQYERRLV
jgi:hypothetical protein